MVHNLLRLLMTILMILYQTLTCQRILHNIIITFIVVLIHQHPQHHHASLCIPSRCGWCYACSSTSTSTSTSSSITSSRRSRNMSEFKSSTAAGWWCWWGRWCRGSTSCVDVLIANAEVSAYAADEVCFLYTSIHSNASEIKIKNIMSMTMMIMTMNIKMMMIMMSNIMMMMIMLIMIMTKNMIWWWWAWEWWPWW